MVLAILQDGATLDAAELREYLMPRLPRFMVPRFVEIVRDLPRTPATNRVQKHVLRERGFTAATWDGEKRRGAVVTPDELE